MSSGKNPIVRDDSSLINYERISPSRKLKHRGRSESRKKGSKHSESRKSSPRVQEESEHESLPHNKEGSRERTEKSTYPHLQSPVPLEDNVSPLKDSENNLKR